MTKLVKSIGARAWIAVSLFAPLVLSPFFASPARAEIEITTTVRHEMGAPELEIADGELLLDLGDAVATALERNLALVVQRHVRTRSMLSIAEALGIYDFDLQAFYLQGENTSPVVSQLVDTGGAAQVVEFSSWNTNLSRLIPIGGVVTASFDNNRSETNDAFFSLNPRFNQSFDLSYNQPLLRNLGRLTTERNLIVARIGSAISHEDFEEQLQEVVQQVSDTYWRLVESRELLKVAEESLALAEQLQRMNEIQVEVGTMAPIEVFQSEANVATRREQIITRQAAVHDNEDELRRLLNLDQGPLWETTIVPTSEAEIDFVEVDVEEAIAVALAQRNDIRRKQLEIRSSEVDARVAANLKRPRLDFDATYGFDGVGGDQQLVDGGVLPGGFSDAFNQILERDFDGWTLQLTFAYPIRNRAARAQHAQAELAVNQDLAELRDLEQRAITTVRQQARAVRTAIETIESARVSSLLERKNFEAEEKRYENGLSTSLRVVQIQERLSEARSREVAAVANYRRALIALYRATGELLDRFDVEVAREPEEDVIEIERDEDDGEIEDVELEDEEPAETF